jgi:HAD superfamily hydrolase (TIGR01459 family)
MFFGSFFQKRTASFLTLRIYIMTHIDGLSAIAARYDGFILDLWGVVHDGVRPYDAALDCMQRLGGRPILLLSNAPRRATSVQRTLQKLGVADSLYTHILTSGEATWRALRDRSDPWFATLGGRVYHLGPERDRNVFADLKLVATDRPEEADFLLNTGPDDTRETGVLADFVVELSACRAAGLKMICANPDLEIVRGTARILCAGALAAWYEKNGGDVRWIGKPDPAIYQTCLSMLDLPPARVLAIGDSLRTDIAGATSAGIDSLWILGGIHAEELAGEPGAPAMAATRAGLAPIGFMDRLAW